jgi:hypothetical protein
MGKIMITSLLAAAIFFGGCVSGPQQAKAAQSVPDWVLSQPKDDATYKYFVGSGTSKTGDMAEAEKTAVSDIIGKIFFYIGVEITSETTATAKASKDQYEADILQVVKTSGQTKLSGFELMEKLPVQKDKEVTLYILSRYNKKELEARKAEMEKIFKEREEAISGPEAEGITLAKQGKYYQAVVKFIAAAAAASTSKVANADIKFKRNIDQAMDAVDKINLVKLNDNLEGLAGQEFPAPFKVKVVNGADADAPGVPDVVLEINYKVASKTGVSSKSAKMKTNPTGVLEFQHPIPEFVGSDTVKMALNLESYLDALSNVPASYTEMTDSLESLIVGKKVVFDYKVTSNAKNISTGIVILDIDADGRAISKTDTAQALVSALSEEKFKTKNLPLKPSELLDKGDFDVIELLALKYSADVERAIFGTARILNVTDSDGKKIAKCTGTVQVVDLKTKEILLTVVKDVNEMAIATLRRSLQCLKNSGRKSART